LEVRGLKDSDADQRLELHNQSKALHAAALEKQHLVHNLEVAEHKLREGDKKVADLTDELNLQQNYSEYSSPAQGPQQEPKMEDLLDQSFNAEHTTIVLELNKVKQELP